jgi:hypothetical protein
LFGLAAILFMLSGMPRRRRLFWAGFFYFIGMAAYEPVVLLPVYCLVILRVRGAGRKELLQWGMVLGGVLLFYAILRVMTTGWIAGAYEGDFFSMVRRWPGNLVKVGGRVFLPPSEQTQRMVLLFAGVMAALVLVLLYFFRRTRGARGQRAYLAALFLMLAVSLVIPMITAVSTRTTETDRMLYLPSVFFCCILSFLIVTLAANRFWRVVISAGVLIYMVVFLQKANGNWVMASDITRRIVRVATDPAGRGRLFVINLPDEKDGAFIFRLGFPEALAMTGKAGGPPVVVNHLTREQWLAVSDTIRASSSGDGMYIPPAVTIRRLGGDSALISMQAGEDGEKEWRTGGDDRIFYWNKQRLVKVSFP